MRDILDWVDNKAPPWLNLIITAGFHGLHTLAWQLAFGWGFFCALFLYTFKEGVPFLRWAFGGFKPDESPYKPGPGGWTTFWRVADSVADVALPWLVVLLT